MIIGYGRTSTIEQVAGLEAQIRDLKAAGAEKLFRENVSSVAPRQQLEAAIEFAREGDTLVVTKIGRLARSVRHLCEIVDRLQVKAVALRILNMNLDTNDATGKLMLQIIGSIAEKAPAARSAPPGRGGTFFDFQELISGAVAWEARPLAPARCPRPFCDISAIHPLALGRDIRHSCPLPEPRTPRLHNSPSKGPH
jgi:hypothetical protein